MNGTCSSRRFQLTGLVLGMLVTACGQDEARPNEAEASGGLNGGSFSASGGQTASGGVSGQVGGHTSGGTGASRASGGAADGGSESGGAHSGGEAGSGAGGRSSGGSPSGGAGAGGTASGGCVDSTELKAARKARSMGFSGTDAQYSELYTQACSTASDCVAPCTSRGGTSEFCSTSVCVDSEPDYCLPPTKWRNLEGALSESNDVFEAAETSLSISNGPDHDRLLLSDFGLAVPADAKIVGITMVIRHAGGGDMEASDQVVRIVKGGVVGEAPREKTAQWPITLTDEEYGGSGDLWGETWSPADLNAEDFGLAVAALPTDSGGRAYVDGVHAQVHYELPCK